MVSLTEDSLWGDDYNSSEDEIKDLIKRSKPKQVKVYTEKSIKSKTVPIEEKLNIIRANVLRILGVYKENTVVIKTREQLHQYIDSSMSNGVIAVDTETNNSLDPISCKLMGPCIYTPGQKNAYIPVNHINPITRERLSWQLTEKDIKEEFQRFNNSSTEIIMHNGKFDYQVIKCTCSLELRIDWDTLIAARLLNENERAGLKEQYISKIDPSIEKYSIEHLFEGIEYAVVDPEIFALYAATDSFMTYKLKEWQAKQFALDTNKRIYNLFKTVEMLVVKVTASMELAGVRIDTEYSKRLSKKYHKKLDDIDIKIAEELKTYDDKISAWRATSEANFKPKTAQGKLGKSKNEQLSDPISITSTTQLAIFIYDILGLEAVDKKTPRGTGEDILVKLNEKHHIPLFQLILDRRGLDKLIGTYIDKLPECVSPVDNRLHAHFNQYGADTGRFSSSDPNLQNIPSHEKSIRMMFAAAEGNVLVGSDFSQQEPRLLSTLAADPQMIEAYKQGKDFYATLAVGVYNNTYWENMEHWEDGSPNPEGKKRRGICKQLLLGILYGMGPDSLAEKIGKTKEEAEDIIQKFYKGFPVAKAWIDKTESDAVKNGYVEDLWGRRRRLPDIQLPLFTVEYKNSADVPLEFNPLIGSKNVYKNPKNSLIEKYTKMMQNARYRKEKEDITSQALKEGIIIHSNSSKISQAKRQCVNARVQGSASTMSKKAMINVHNDPELNRLGFKILIAVHDELIGECPEENAEAVASRLTEVMKHAADPDAKTPFKCDPTIEKCWYYSDYSDTLQNEYQKLIKDCSSDEEKQNILSKFYENHCECTKEQLNEIIGCS